MILTPLIDIDNLNLFKIEPLWSLMTKEEKNKDISDISMILVHGEKNKDISVLR